MEDLKAKFDRLKSGLKKKEDEDKKMRSDVKSAIDTVLCNLNIGKNCLEDFYLKNGTLFLLTKNKVYANELFIKKSLIEEILKPNKNIKEIVIR